MNKLAIYRWGKIFTVLIIDKGQNPEYINNYCNQKEKDKFKKKSKHDKKNIPIVGNPNIQ